MATTVTIRNVPDDVMEALLRQAREQGESLEELLLSVLERQAAGNRNREFLAEVRRGLAEHGGAGPDAPDAAEVIRRARRGEYDA